MKQKAAAAALAVTMCAALLAGCGSSSSGDSASSESSTAAQTGSTENTAAVSDGSVTKTAVGEYTEDNPYQLTFAYIEFYQQDANERQAVQDAMNEYLIPNYHIQVTLLPLEAAQFQQTLQLMISGGDKLDVMPIYFSNASSWIGMNGIVDMNPYMDSEDGQKIIEALGEDNAYVGETGGVLYGFPANKESVDIGGLCMRADICDALGITDKYGLTADGDDYTGKVYSWDVAEDILRQVHEAYPDMIPLYLQGSNASTSNRMTWMDPLSDSFGVLDWNSDHASTTVVNEYETDAYREVATRIARWYDDGLIYKDAATDTQGSATMMKAGNTFSYMTAIKPGLLAEADAGNGTTCYAMYFGNHVEGGLSTINVSYFNTGIASNSDDPEMAFKFISVMYSDPTWYNLWQYGIEGTDYQVLDDGTAYYPEGVDDTNFKYHQNTGWCMGNQFISYVWNNGTKTADYWDELRDYNEWAYYSPAYGFMWDATDYQTQLTALQNALSTYRPALETGAIGGAENVDATLQSLNDALYAAGLQTVMDAKQEQLDAWLSEHGAAETPQENLDKIAGGEVITE